MMNLAIKILVITIIIAVLGYNYLENESQKRNKVERELLQQSYAEEQAWKKPLLDNCANALRSVSDRNTLTFSYIEVTDYKYQYIYHYSKELIEKTDNGYAVYMYAEDASTNMRIICYTNNSGQVLDIVPDKADLDFRLRSSGL